jgi:hypothetical protein
MSSDALQIEKMAGLLFGFWIFNGLQENPSTLSPDGSWSRLLN